MTVKEAIAVLVEGKNLTRLQMQQVMEEIMAGGALPAQVAALLVSLRMKGETIDEITGAALAMRRFVRRINIAERAVLDTCGTGGDRRNTFNISTISAFVAAAAGVVVAKHGNRAVSSHCGSADLLEALGININIDENKVEECLEKTGIAFLFARNFHPAMKSVAQVRQELGLRTIFNLLGPLTNPAFASRQLLGVFDEKLLGIFARVLAKLGSSHALVVHGLDGLDEITTTTFTRVWELRKGKIRSYKINPCDFGIKKSRPRDLEGGSAGDNALIALDVLKGNKGPKRDIVLLNAGCAIYAADKAGSIKSGISLATEAIDSVAALRKLEELKIITNS